MFGTMVFIGAADVFHTAGQRHIADKDSNFNDAFQQGTQDPVVFRQSSVIQQHADEELGQPYKNENGCGNADYH